MPESRVNAFIILRKNYFKAQKKYKVINITRKLYFCDTFTTDIMLL
jgi:hypothetical protein